MSSDRQLLEHYATTGSESAFAELVGRHLDLVYSAALRVVAGDQHLAEDVTQTVFVELSRKAGRWPNGIGVAGWLYRCAWFTATKMVRAEHRRRVREQASVEMTVQEVQPEAAWKDIAPILEEAVNRLGTIDREAILLRFFQGRELAAIGAVLGLSEDATQKRVQRALEKLRQYLGRRRVAVSCGTLSTVLLTEAVKTAPTALTLAVSTAVASGAGVAGTGMMVALMENRYAGVGGAFRSELVPRAGNRGGNRRHQNRNVAPLGNRGVTPFGAGRGVEPVWVLREVVLLAHEQSLAAFGGSAGIRDAGLLDSALGKPHHLFAYGKPTLFSLAASYALGLVKNQPFIDGNKRVGFVVAVLFLELNGTRFQATEVDAALRTLALAAGELSEAAYAQWLKANSKRR